MKLTRLLVAVALAAAIGQAGSAGAQNAKPVLAGKAAFGDWRSDAPGVRRHITASDLPPPFSSASVRNRTESVPDHPAGKLQAPEGFEVKLFAKGLNAPRLIRAAPNGDIFVAESAAGRIRVLLPSPDGASVSQME